MKLIINYKLETVQDIINRYAPPVENNTLSYILDVAEHVGVKATDVIDVEIPDILIRLSEAIIHHENGIPPDNTPPMWYTEEVFEQAARMILGE